MKMRTGFTKGHAALPLTVVLGLALMTVVAGCAAGSGARLDRSQEVFDMFQEGKVVPGYRYYTTGVPNDPDAILGVSEKYTLVTERWAELKATTDLLRQRVGLMDVSFMAPDVGIIGCWVLSDKGERIGVWYSGVGITGVEMLSETEVRIDPPNTIAIRQMKERSSK